MTVTAPLIVAHRGASADLAEHTLAAYRLAVDQGADGLECDVQLTRDRVVVCQHDGRVDRTSDGTGYVSLLSSAQLSRMDFGSWHRNPRPQLGPLRLDDLLDLVKQTGVRLFLETKQPNLFGGLLERAVVDTLRRHGLAEATEQIIPMSFSTMAVRRFHQLAPQLTGVLLLNKLSARRLDGGLPSWASITGPGIHLLRADPDYVRRAARHGHRTYCWTVDEPADIELCERLGVSYLATNHPAQTRAAQSPELG
ncbi:glycerophosphodiester phosphodiesterase [Pseudonocardiaceae bacterium YIM PH 21723]|nr:glycerophosphodiester phosphodiesterase [Pseudonocardiaceae bacterium YIM PH 21723]